MSFKRFMIILWFMLWTYYNIVGIDVIRADNIGISVLQDNPSVINWKEKKLEYLLFVNNKMDKILWTHLKKNYILLFFITLSLLNFYFIYTS